MLVLLGFRQFADQKSFFVITDLVVAVHDVIGLAAKHAAKFVITVGTVRMDRQRIVRTGQIGRFDLREAGIAAFFMYMRILAAENFPLLSDGW